MISNDTLDAVTPLALASGVRVLQGNMLAQTEAEHVSVLLRHFSPPHGAMIADIGCGFGEVARLMRAERPDLDFVLINQNKMQMDEAPACFRQIVCDMHTIPLPDGAVDAAMFCYSLCHGDLERALMEAARITRFGGKLFVYDYERLRGDNALMTERLFAQARPSVEIHAAAYATGWMPVIGFWTGGDDTRFREAYGNDAEYDRIFDDLEPSIWVMERR